MQGSIVKIFVGQSKEFGIKGSRKAIDRPFLSSIGKEEVFEQVWLGKTNLSGDSQADKKVHGGPDKAVLCYCLEHYDFWKKLYGMERSSKRMGENLLISGLNEDIVCIGDEFKIGDVARVQISEYRMPCWKLGRYWGVKALPKQVQDTGKMGWYMRVIAEGFIEKGQQMVLVNRPLPKWTVAKINRKLYIEKEDLEAAKELVASPYLSEAAKKPFAKRIEALPASSDEKRLFGMP
ncbi:MAG: MOSC domain-containing protein [Oligoflexales bacterium]